MSNDHTRGHTGIQRTLTCAQHRMCSAVVWAANHARQYQRRWRVAIIARKRCEACSIAIENRSRRDTVDEPCTAETFARKRARECRRPCGNYLRHPHPAVLDVVDNLQQTIIAGMRRRGPFALIQPTILPVIVVQAAELQPCIFNPTHKSDNFVSGLCSTPVRFMPGFMSRKTPTGLPRHCRTCSSFSARTEMRMSGN